MFAGLLRLAGAHAPVPAFGWRSQTKGAKTKGPQGLALLGMLLGVLLAAPLTAWAATPSITGVTPGVVSTAGGTSVTITGSGFTGTNAVKFGGTNALGFTINSDTQITATAPSGTFGSQPTLFVTNGSGTGNLPLAVVYLDPPVVSGVSPSSGPSSGGNTVTITGSGFEDATMQVNFGGATVFVSPDSPTQITATAPAGAVGTVDVTVTSVVGTSPTSAADHYTYLPTPAISSVSPSSGPTTGGTTVILTGSNFTGATAVHFGATSAGVFTVNSATQITVTEPAGSAGTVDITVTTPAGGTSATGASDHFTYMAAPTVSSISPTAGPTAGAASVVITGTNFSTASAVHFGAAAAGGFTIDSATQITATSPAGTGTVDVTVTNASGTSVTSAADQYTFVPPPTVTGVGPTSGPTTGATSVVITGTNLTGASAVSFGGTAAAGFTVNSATQITATAPAGTGTVDVRVTTAGGTSATGAADQYAYVPAPTVTALSVTAGPTAGGTFVTISGTNFTGASAVRFGATSVGFTVVSATQISVTAPAGAAGTVDVTVNTVGGTSATSAADQFTYVSLPTVTSISPTAGPTAGGTSVVITGTNLSGASAVSFGGTAAAGFVVNSATQITATAPAGTGTVDVRVTTAGGTTATSAADQFTFVPPPTVTGVSPTAGPTTGGTTVTVTGTNFTGASAVSFGATAAAGFVVNSATQITATAPAGTGTVDVRVTTVGGTSATGASDQYSFVPAPTVSGISPTAGPTAGGTTVTITGSNFTGATAVTFGGTTASFTVVSATQITATSPAGAAGTVDVRVTTVGGTSATSAADQFTHVAPPTVTAISPTAGPTAGGTTVVITGSNFLGASAVTFGGTSAGFTINSATQITATAPAGSAGIVDVRVTTVGGTSAAGAADQFTYVPPPTVTTVNPTAGPTTGGNTVVITGTNFSGASAVSFGGTAASFTVSSATTIIAAAPAGAAGTVDVRVTTVGGTSATSAADHYVYVAAPIVGAISPPSGPSTGGGSVTITGSNFTGATTVMFGAAAATGFTINSDTQITATAPAGATVMVDVRVSNLGGTSAITAADRYAYINAPYIIGVSPAAGPTAGGTTVTITGQVLAGVTAVSFGGAPAAGFTVVSNTSITAVSPAGAAGMADIRVTSLGGTSMVTSSDQFRYAAAPTVASLSPASGPATGGTLVTIAGSNFTGATAVSFGGTPASGFTVVSATQITAHAPASAVGAVDVTVTTPAGTSATGAGDRYAYQAGPAVTAVSPATGPSSGGTAVTVTGTGFTGATAVRFGATPTAGFTVVSATQITVTAPAGAAGSVDITVVAPGGTSPTSAADAYAYVATPAVQSLSPNTGPTAGGTVVTLHGQNLAGVTAVSFGATPAAGFTVVSATEITATAPAGAAGTVNVTVVTPGGASAATTANAYAYVAAPAVSAVSPASGPVAGGNTVTITGSGFAGVTGVSFGGTAAAGFTVSGPTQITATAPAGAVGTVDVTVITAGGASPTSAADHYAYTAGPTVSAVSPAAGPVSGGNTVTITGANFTGVTAVRFGAASAAFTVASASQITATAPAGPVGQIDVTVTTAGGASPTGAADRYQYVTAPTAGAVTATVSQDSSSDPIALALAGGPATGVAVASGPAHGTVSVSGLTVTYTPAAGYAGADSFTYTATGPGGTSNAATASLTVQALAPTAATKAVTVTAPAGGAGGPVTIDLSGSVSNASGIVVSTPPQHGTVTVNHFVVTYTPTPGYFGTDSFAFEAVSGAMTSAPATVTITLANPTLAIAPTSLPAAQSGVAYSQVLAASGGTAPYSYQLTGTLPAGLSFDPATATLSGTPTGAASASLSLKATDSSTGTGPFSVTQAYTLTVTLGAPTAAAKAVTELAGQPVVIHAADGATGGPFTGAAIASPPATGTTAVSGTDITFTAPATASGKVTFSYTLANAAGTSAPATVTVTVNPVPTTPGPIVVQVAADKSGQADVTTGAAGGPFTGAAIVSLSPSNAGTAQVASTGAGTFAIRFTPAQHFSGPAVVTYTLSNAFATSAPGTVTFQVAARPDPTQDPDVRGLVSAQGDAAIRFAQAQMDNINQRLESLHTARGAGNHYGMTFTFGDAAQLQSPEDMPWRRSDVLSMQRDASTRGLFGQIPQAYNAAAQAPAAAGGKAVAGDGGSTPASGGGNGGSGSGAPGNLALWTGGAVDFGLHHTGGGYRGLHFTTAGVSVGGDYRVSDQLTVGVAAGYGQDTTHVGSNGTEDRATSYLGAVYGSYHPAPAAFIDAVVGYGQSHFDSRRYDSVNAEMDSGRRAGDEVFASLTAAWQFKRERTILSPYGKLDVVSGHLDPFTETGGAGALAYGRQSVNSLRTTLGLRGDYLVVTHDGVWAPHFRLEYQHEFQGAGGFDLQYADWLSGPTYRGQLLPLGQNHLVGGIGTDFTSADWKLSLDYKVDVTTNSDVTNQIVVRVLKTF